MVSYIFFLSLNLSDILSKNLMNNISNLLLDKISLYIEIEKHKIVVIFFILYLSLNLNPFEDKYFLHFSSYPLGIVIISSLGRCIEDLILFKVANSEHKTFANFNLTIRSFV